MYELGIEALHLLLDPGPWEPDLWLLWQTSSWTSWPRFQLLPGERSGDSEPEPVWLGSFIARATWSSRATSKLSYMSMRTADGRLVPLKDRADTIATYLEQQHWSNSNGQGLLPYNDLIGEIPTCDNSLFSLQELHLILKRCKVNKQPGPDQVIVELYRWLNTSNRQFLLDILNEWWAEGLVPHDILTARVVPIYKKGNIDNPSNYRPISFLNSIYKGRASCWIQSLTHAIRVPP